MGSSEDGLGKLGLGKLGGEINLAFGDVKLHFGGEVKLLHLSDARLGEVKLHWGGDVKLRWGGDDKLQFGEIKLQSKAAKLGEVKLTLGEVILLFMLLLGEVRFIVVKFMLLLFSLLSVLFSMLFSMLVFSTPFIFAFPSPDVSSPDAAFSNFAFKGVFGESVRSVGGVVDSS